MASPLDDPGVPAALRYTESLIENPSPELMLRYNGATGLSRLENFHKRYRQKVRDQQVQRYGTVHESAGQRATDTARAVEQITKDLQAQLRAMKGGTLSPDEVMRFIAQAIRTVKAVEQTCDGIERDSEAATAMIDTDPSEWQQAEEERFPLLANSLPVLTEGYLTGETDADPLGEA